MNAIFASLTPGNGLDGTHQFVHFRLHFFSSGDEFTLASTIENISLCVTDAPVAFTLDVLRSK
jgi:hypothetical protein